MTTKDSGFRIRVQRDLRERFLSVCRAQDKPAAQVIREFMRDYVERHGVSGDIQGERKAKARRGATHEY
jgi:predicted transcriptional regulator